MNCKLYTTLYLEKRPNRAAELRMALEMNLRAFDAVRVLAEGIRSDIGESRSIDRRQKYSDLLQWAADARSDDITVIANCDIAIPATSVGMMAENLKAGEVYALSRYENGRLHNTPWSQDVWAFRGPPPVNCGDYFFGIPGVDNRFAHELDALGYRVLNPSKTIVTIHLHASGMRTVTNSVKHRVDPPYLLIKPHSLDGHPEYLRVPDLHAFEQQLRLDRRERRQPICESSKTPQAANGL